MSTQTERVVIAPEPRFDFPTWLPPMLVKELRQGLRTRGFVGSMVGFQAVMVIAFVWAFAVDIFGESQAQGTVNGFFWGVLGVLLMVITPLRAMAGLRQEIEAKTLDLLMLTDLTAWRIVLGKWTSLMAQGALLVLALLPYGLVRYFFGAVDLLQDLLGIAAMYLGCGVLTALALWVSGLPKLFRIGLPIAFVMLFQGAGGFMFNGFFRHMSFSTSGSPGWTAAWVLVVNGVLLLLFCLVQAVRRIAPPSDNHSPLARGLALLTLVPAAVLFTFANSTLMGAQQLLVAFVALIFVSVIELASMRRPMAVQVRTWWNRGRLRSGIGYLVLPGWPSAALFTAFWLGLAAIPVLIGLTKIPTASGTDMVWLFTLLWTALVFPVLLLSFVPSVARQAPAIYFILQAVFGIFALIEANSPHSGPTSLLAEMFRWLAHFLPATSFWLEAERFNRHSTSIGAYFPEQVVMVGLVCGVTAWRMFPYWHWVKTQALLAGRETKAVPPTE